MLECFEANQDPLKSMNIHLAIRWIVRSWNHFLINTTMYNCFRKSTLITQTQDDDEEEGRPEEPVYSIQEARKAMQVLIKFTECSAELQTAHLRAIERLEHELEAPDLNRRVQSNLDGWIT
jgi:hypothetical protein